MFPIQLSIKYCAPKLIYWLTVPQDDNVYTQWIGEGVKITLDFQIGGSASHSDDVINCISYESYFFKKLDWEFKTDDDKAYLIL